MTTFFQWIVTIFAFYVCVPTLSADELQTVPSESANSLEDKGFTSKNLRIQDLLPNLAIPLPVEPGIPADFVALSPDGVLDPADWIYWGPEDVLRAYFKEPASLQVPILRVKLSTNVFQSGPRSFDDGNSMDFIKTKKKTDPSFAFKEYQWGDYPVLAIKTKIKGQTIFTAWVGLNSPETGSVLMFNLIYPLDKKGHPNDEDSQLWESLLTKTTPLEDGDFFKACGQDLQEGFTLVNLHGAKLKMIAEKRESDGTIQVVVIPESSDVEFHYDNMLECLMGAKWKYKEPLVKVYGEITLKKNNFGLSCQCVTSIFFKTVKEFSIKKEDGKNSLIFQKACEETD